MYADDTLQETGTKNIIILTQDIECKISLEYTSMFSVGPILKKKEKKS